MKNLTFTILGMLLVFGGAFAISHLGADFTRAEAPEAQEPEPPPEPTKEEKRKKKVDEFFAKGEILRLRIDLAPAQLERMKKDERNYAEATLTEETPDGQRVYEKVSIKLKGSAGSFQHLDGKPGITLSMEKLKGGERFHGLKKFHLNNCVQDGTYLNELIAGEMARKAGVPASRCSHAFVNFNGRDMGLYVLKEGFTKDFLASFFDDPDGGLYEVPAPQELNENMQKQLGEPKDRKDIKELIAACQEADNAKRWERLGKILDIDKFISFCVMEDFLCHWDGYNFNRNNFRLYHEPTSGKMYFILHGMDQMFGDTNFPVIRDWPAMVGSAVMRCPQAPPMYRARAQSIYETVLKNGDWPGRVVTEGRRVRDAIAAKDAKWAKDYDGQINGERDRVAERIRNIGRQLDTMPQPVAFDASGILALPKGWQVEDSGGSRADEGKLDGKDCLHIVAQGATSTSWRVAVHLDAGKYRFEALARTTGVAASEDAKGKGAGLRISGSTTKRADALEGDSGWKPLSYEFETPGGDIVLVAELRATKGEVWFQRESLRLTKAK